MAGLPGWTEGQMDGEWISHFFGCLNPRAQSVPLVDESSGYNSGWVLAGFWLYAVQIRRCINQLNYPDLPHQPPTARLHVLE